MVANFLIRNDFTLSQRFFAEKLLELFLNRTLDSHRAKLNNPRCILKELYQVLGDWHQKKIKHFDKTIKPIVLETLKFLDSDETLLFNSISKKYYKSLLGNANDRDYNKLSHATNLILGDNINYCERLFEISHSEIRRLNVISISSPSELIELSKILDYLGTELINSGYNKGYLYKIISLNFGITSPHNFSIAFNYIKSLCCREEEQFDVVFKLKSGSSKHKINFNTAYLLTDEQIISFEGVNEKSEVFFKNKGDGIYYLGIREKGLDYLAVIEKAKRKLFYLIDILHLGFPEVPFFIDNKCLVKGEKKPQKTQSHNTYYRTDGKFKNNQAVYEKLSNKIEKLQINANVQKESTEKIISAIRHLRLGRDSSELEQKFINYWIGLEYIFSNYDIRENNTISRIKQFFIQAHVVIYLRRNLLEFHSDIKRLKLKNFIPGFDDNIEYLKDPATYDYIIKHYFTTNPLLSFRAYKYKELVTDAKILKQVLNKHNNNLDWHLTRSYRIRNEIVHDAAIHLNIELITSNLKYYLTFILNGILEYLHNNLSRTALKHDNIGIDDYFMLNEIRYNSIEGDGFLLQDLMNERSATEFFT